jgi:hypothetical protein
MADEERGSGTLAVKALFAALALGSVLAGLLIHLLQQQLGIPSDTARTIAIVFIAVGAADALLLYFWDATFGRRG